jgi:hypothetical protein
VSPRHQGSSKCEIVSQGIVGSRTRLTSRLQPSRRPRTFHGAQAKRFRGPWATTPRALGSQEHELDHRHRLMKHRAIGVHNESRATGFLRFDGHHHQGHSPGKVAHNGDQGEEEASLPSVVHIGVQGRHRRLCRRGDRSVGQMTRDFDLTETNIGGWMKQAETDRGGRPDLTLVEKGILHRGGGSPTGCGRRSTTSDRLSTK